jgi:outer membrane receptor protein involved in Fe transport
MKQMLLLLLFLSLFSNSFPGITGKLAGRVTDAQTGEPLIGVNVIIEGTSLGDATDKDGYFLVNNIPPGEYRISFSFIGYQKQTIVKVKISADFTTKLDAQLTSQTLVTDAVIIEAKAPLIREDLTSSQTTIDAGQIENLPVESIGQLLVLQAGVTTGVGGEIHIRGGRSSEIAYTINGISINNPFDNSQMVQIATNAIQELSVISGTFNAEYGNAMSGVVNTITKEGGVKYSGHVAVYSGDYISTRKSTFFNIDDINPANNFIGEATFGGPIYPDVDQVTLFLSGRYETDNGYLYGIREHNTSDHAIQNKLYPDSIKIISTGDNEIVPMNTSNRFNATWKLSFKPTPTLKINYDGLYSKSKSRGYNHSYKYNPDGRLNYFDEGLLNSFELRHTLSSTTFYSFKGSYSLNNYSSYLYPLLYTDGSEVKFKPGMSLDGLIADSRYQPTDFGLTPFSYTFLFGGTQNGHYYESAKTYLAKFDITSQVTKNHEIKIGLETKFHQLDYESFTVRRDTTTYLTPTILGTNTPYHDFYIKKPNEFSAYAQDKMEFDNMIINLGIRYDFFQPKSVYSTNIYYPSPNDPLLPSFVDKNSLLAEAKPKHQISPRLGISFPITDKGIIHFSYGHFFQMPPFSYLYQNADFKYNLAYGEPVIGNADLRPEKTVTYELGLQQQLLEDLAFNVTGFYKDVRDLIATQTIRTSGSSTYLKYVNKDYGNIKGVTFTLTKRKTADSPFGVTIDYTFQSAEGNDNNSDAFFLDLSSGKQSEKLSVFLPWDQTHTLNGTLSFGEARDWNVSLVTRLGTGLPYTPQIYEKQIYIRPMSGRRPFTSRVDLMAEKIFRIFNYDISVFIKIYNLFDTLNERIVYLDTGRSTYTLQSNTTVTRATDEYAKKIPGVHPTSDYFNRPDYYSAPREVNLGFSFEF